MTISSPEMLFTCFSMGIDFPYFISDLYFPPASLFSRVILLLNSSCFLMALSNSWIFKYNNSVNFFSPIRLVLILKAYLRMSFLATLIIWDSFSFSSSPIFSIFLKYSWKNSSFPLKQFKKSVIKKCFPKCCITCDLHYSKFMSFKYFFHVSPSAILLICRLHVLKFPWFYIIF